MRAKLVESMSVPHTGPKKNRGLRRQNPPKKLSPPCGKKQFCPRPGPPRAPSTPNGVFVFFATREQQPGTRDNAVASVVGRFAFGRRG